MSKKITVLIDGGHLRSYLKKTKASEVIYLVIDVGGPRKRTKDLADLLNSRRAANNRVPTVVLIDAVPKTSASNLPRLMVAMHRAQGIYRPKGFLPSPTFHQHILTRFKIETAPRKVGLQSPPDVHTSQASVGSPSWFR